MNSAKRKKRISRISSSEEEGKDDVCKTPERNKGEKSVQEEESSGTSGRKSSRIRERSNRVFQKPTREEIWDKIPSSSEKSLSKISPNKQINNFTKVYNTYNAESYDLFNDEFINDEEEIDYNSTSSISTDSEEQERYEKRKKKKKIKNRRKRLKFESSSSEDEACKSEKGPESEIKANEKKDLGDKSELKEDNSFKIECKIVQESEDLCSTDVHKEFLDIDCVQEQQKSSSDEESQIFQHLNSSKHKNVLVSDSDSDQKDEEKNRNNDENSDASESESESESEHLSRAEKQLVKKRNKFQNFKDAQARFKEKHRRQSANVPVNQQAG